jgi:hypothetical protein
MALMARQVAMASREELPMPDMGAAAVQAQMAATQVLVAMAAPGEDYILFILRVPIQQD